MQAPITKLDNATAIVIKLVEISAHKPLSAGNANGKQFSAGRGEAGILQGRADRKGASIERGVKPCQLVTNFWIPEKGGALTLIEGTKNVEAPTHVAFVPVFAGFDEAQRVYDAEMHRAALVEVLRQALDITLEEGVKAKASDITVRMTPPGTFEGREASEARKTELEQWLLQRGVHVQWQTASADLPQEERQQYRDAQPVNYGAFSGAEGDVFVAGSRDLRTQRVSDAMREVGRLLIQGQQAQRLIVPLAIGANLALAEAGVQAGVPVVLAYIGSKPETWAEANAERVNALVAAGATIVGDANTEWAQGLFSASVEDMARRVISGGGKVALMTPEGDDRSEAKRLAGTPGVRNFFPQVREYLNSTLGSGVLDAELAQAQSKRDAAPAATLEGEPVIPF